MFFRIRRFGQGAVRSLARRSVGTPKSRVCRNAKSLQFSQRQLGPRCLTTASGSAATTTVAVRAGGTRNWRNFLFRCAWVPYALLSTIPTGMGIMGLYYYAKGDERHAKGHFFYCLTSYLCLPLSVPVLLAAPYVRAFDWDHRRFMNKIQQIWARTTAKPFFKTIVTGNEEVKKLNGAPAIFVANHLSWLDTYAIFHIDDLPLRIVLKRELLWIPVVGWVMSLIGHIPFNRKDKRSGRGVIDHCKNLLHSGVSVFFFPEGTRSKDGSLGKFKYGAFNLAVDTRVPIVPITIRGTREMMPPGDEMSLGNDDLYVKVHRAIYPKEGETSGELMARVRELMLEEQLKKL